MEIKQLEAAIQKKADERAEARARQFVEKINAAWKEFFGHNFHFHNMLGNLAEEKERLEKVFEAISRTEGSRYFSDRDKFIMSHVVEQEKKRVVDDILKATEAVRELADMRGEES